MIVLCLCILIDGDECTTGSHNCQHNCHNTLGSYFCSCQSGYDLNSDGRTCRGESKRRITFHFPSKISLCPAPCISVLIILFVLNTILPDAVIFLKNLGGEGGRGGGQVYSAMCKVGLPKEF